MHIDIPWANEYSFHITSISMHPVNMVVRSMTVAEPDRRILVPIIQLKLHTDLPLLRRTAARTIPATQAVPYQAGDALSESQQGAFLTADVADAQA